MTKLQKTGLILFVSVCFLNVAGLSLDAVLASIGAKTVTDFARKNQWLAAIVILINAIGLIGLVLHFADVNGE